ncbi:MAG: hypothetical protein ACM3II_16140 [Rhodospirillaceae bacterium]
MNLFLLGLKALWRERNLLVLTSTGLAAILGPLLLLYGFKFGVIAGLLSALRDDPGNREIVLRGNYVLHGSDIERYRGMPEVAFVQPASRTIAARMEFVGPEPGHAVAAGSLLPTAAGDPLLPPGMAVGPGQMALSSSLAERLHAKAGDHIKGYNRRMGERGSEQIDFEFVVVHVVDRRYATGDRAYVIPDMLFALEAFLDGYELPERGISGKPAAERQRVAENVRMYARSIEDVPALDARLSAAGYMVYSKADEVAGILNLNHGLAAAFTFIAAIGSVGYAVSLATGLLGNIAQQRKFLSLVRLMGAPRHGLLLFPLAQGLAIAAAGFLLSVALFAVVAHLANLHFARYLPSGTPICQLAPEHYMLALAGTLVVVGAVVGWVGRTLFGVTPAEVLHAE